MAKFEVISQKPSKTKKLPFLTLFGQKIPNFEFSHGYHYCTTRASRHLGEDLRKFSAKTNDKN